ncbi:hypothetical protein [Thalassotalea agarivorans]|uniref:Uncharacterized protein n=1 Tax=Thalassotalea agarivorans TaxID=349064 RepID=A0A1I0H033_THASX|nr:hypothetical protein [Thalassotalea agarivorans]SET76885.1 hypothetical protein SAMN05660429_02618 [Thalassotalea agarivorans]
MALEAEAAKRLRRLGILGLALFAGYLFYSAAEIRAHTAECELLTKAVFNDADKVIAGVDIYCDSLKTNIATVQRVCPDFSVPNYSAYSKYCS